MMLPDNHAFRVVSTVDNKFFNHYFPERELSPRREQQHRASVTTGEGGSSSQLTFDVYKTSSYMGLS